MAFQRNTYISTKNITQTYFLLSDLLWQGKYKQPSCNITLFIPISFDLSLLFYSQEFSDDRTKHFHSIKRMQIQTVQGYFVVRVYLYLLSSGD